MGAIVNGLNLHWLPRATEPRSSRSRDYMRGAQSGSSALMRLHAIWVYTHDSIGLGEDGPTHQPIEHLAGLRAMPTLTRVIDRPMQTRWRWPGGSRCATTDRPDGVPLRGRSPDPRTRPQFPMTRSSAVRTCCADSKDRRPGVDPDRDRHRGAHLHGRCGVARRRRDRYARGQHAVRRELCRPPAEATVTPCCRRVPGAGIAVEAASPSAGTGGCGAGVRRSGWRASAHRDPRSDVQAFGLTPDRVAESARQVARAGTGGLVRVESSGRTDGERGLRRRAH